MPDITMCDGTDCPKKDTCHRHKAKPSPYGQSMFVDPPFDHDKEKCSHFWPTQQDNTELHDL
jgi:hypothetical protein